MTGVQFMLANLNRQDVADLLRRCARDIILPYHGRLEAHHKGFKGGDPNNEVTVADRMAEDFLAAALTALVPGSVVVGEEGTEANPSILDHLKDGGKIVWVIDPIDGTSNFARGDDTFCVMVALVAGGEVRMGWIYDPVADSLAFAEKDKGAFIDDVRHTVGKDMPALPVAGYTGAHFAAGRADLRIESLRCSGLEYFRILKGEAHFSLYGKTKPWDHLAGTLLIQEAGGIVRKWDGTAYRPGDQTGGLITATSQALWQELRNGIPQSILQKNGISP